MTTFNFLSVFALNPNPQKLFLIEVYLTHNRGADRRRVPRKQAELDCVVRGVRSSSAILGDTVAENKGVTSFRITPQNECYTERQFFYIKRSKTYMSIKNIANLQSHGTDLSNRIDTPQGTKSIAMLLLHLL